MNYVCDNKQSRFTGMSAAVLINGSIILAVALSPLVVEPRMPIPITIGRNIPYDPPPPPTDEAIEAKPITPIFVPKPIFGTIKPPVDPVDPVEIVDREPDAGPVMDGKGGDDMTETIRDIVKPPVAVFKAATRNPRFARYFQPDYPVRMLQREIEGTITVRVLIGIDGRVRQVQVISATEPEFAQATERQALKSWRFNPATRGDDAVEDWQTLTVRFDIN